MTRRHFGLAVAAGAVETAWAQHAAVTAPVPPGTVWLNANENPEGVPEAAKTAIAAAIAEAGRYNHRVFPEYHAALAQLAGMKPEEIIAGAGSTEVLHCAVDAFTTADHPLITVWPTWEMTRDVAEASGRPVVKVPLTAKWEADVERLAAAAKRAGGGAIHLGNPNNPTSSITPKAALDWLAANLPANTVLLVDEAYLQFSDVESCVSHVRAGRPVVVTRTFSKLYGMAGVRAGYGCAPAELVKRMLPFKNNVPSILGARAVMAVAALGDSFVADRRARRNRLRAEFCRWLDSKGLHYIPPQGNFVLIEIHHDVSEVIPKMLAEGVAVGRRFDTLDTWMRVAVGTAEEMEKFEGAFLKCV